jgi:Xaa-Pro aminopeptidase
VFVDTDAFGVEGYFADVSRTFLVGDVAPTTAQLDAYSVAHDWLLEASALIGPGLTMREFSERAPKLPERYRAQRYECLAHSAGLEDEGPSIAWPGDPHPNGERVIEPGMVLCLEVYCGEVGARDGVKLEDQIEITETGSTNQSPFPFSQVLLGA